MLFPEENWSPGAMWEAVGQGEANIPIPNPMAQAQAPGGPAFGGPQPMQPPQQQPMQQPMPQQQQPMGMFGQAMNTPGASMAGAALQNLVNTSLGQYGRQVDPIQAYQQTVQNQAVMEMRKRQMTAAEKAQEAQTENARQKTAIDLYKLLNPEDSAGTEKMKNYMKALGLDPDDPGAIQDPRIVDFLKNSGGGVKVDVNMPGENPLAGPAGMDTTAAQTAFRDNLTQLPKLLTIGQQYKPEFMTSGGQFKQKLKGLQARIAGGESLSPEDEASLKEYTNFKGGVERYFNAYKKMITGSAGAAEEIEQIRQSIFNMDQSGPEFEAALQGLQDEIARDIRGAIYLQAQGVAEMGTPEMEKELNKRGATDFTAPSMMNAVGDYIAGTLGFDTENMTPEQQMEVAKQLKAMGFGK